MAAPVSRETTPKIAHAIFGPRIGEIDRYADILASEGVKRGLIGPRETDRLWTRHLTNCASVIPALPQVGMIADVGSGGGLPGLVWAIGRPDAQLTLIEPLLRRTTFLDEVIQELKLSNVLVIRARANEVHETFDVVTARAVARLDKLGRWCMPLVERPGGRLLALKGRAADAEVEEARPTLHRLGATSVVVRQYPTDGEPTTVVEVTT